MNLFTHGICVCYVILFSLPYAYPAKLKLSVIPSRKVIAGDKLILSCSLETTADQTRKKITLVWKKDGKDIAEFCRMFEADDRMSCSESKGTYRFEISKVEMQDQGTWGCSYGARLHREVIIGVVVPALVRAPRIFAVEQGPQLHNIAPPIMASSNRDRMSMAQSISDDQLFPRIVGLGTRDDPIDLTGSRGANGARKIIVQCQTTCASVEHNLEWQNTNSTRTDQLRPSVVTSISDVTGQYSGTVGYAPQSSCPNEMFSITGQIQIACAKEFDRRKIGPSTLPQNRADNRMVGLNRITCSVNHASEKAFLDRSISEYARFARRAAFDSKGSVLTDSSNVALQQRAEPVLFDECAQTWNGPQIAPCVYVLCPGHHMPWLTMGERVALAVAIPLFFMLCILLCYLTHQRRRASRKSNLAPGQSHEIELML